MHRFSIATRIFAILSLLTMGPLVLLWYVGWVERPVLWVMPLLALFLYLVARALTRPVRELLRLAERLNAGQLGSQPSAPLSEPWNSLAASMTNLAGNLHTTTAHMDQEVRKRTRALERKASQLRALGQIGQQVAAVLEPSELLHFVVRLVRGTFQYDVVAILRNEGEHLVLSACAARGDADVALGRVFLAPSPAAQLLKAGLIDGGGVVSGQPVQLVDSLHVEAQLVVPIRLGERTIGVMLVQSTTATAFDDDDVFTVRTIAGQLAVALENARLFIAEIQLRGLAITEERNRIAREIHDTLAQSFMAILMHLRAMARAPGPDLADTHRTQAELVAKEGLEEARRSVWNLRPERLERRGLAGALEDEVDRVRNRAGVPIHFECRGDAEGLPPAVAAAVLRVAQESLHNLLKHAKASSAQVRLNVDAGGVELVVSDDGVGFDPAAVAPSSAAGGGFGLGSMRERAQLLGGELILETSPGAGTTIRLRISQIR